MVTEVTYKNGKRELFWCKDLSVDHTKRILTLTSWEDRKIFIEIPFESVLNWSNDWAVKK